MGTNLAAELSSLGSLFEALSVLAYHRLIQHALLLSEEELPF